MSLRPLHGPWQWLLWGQQVLWGPAFVVPISFQFCPATGRARSSWRPGTSGPQGTSSSPSSPGSELSTPLPWGQLPWGHSVNVWPLGLEGEGGRETSLCSRGGRAGTQSSLGLSSPELSPRVFCVCSRTSGPLCQCGEPPDRLPGLQLWVLLRAAGHSRPWPRPRLVGSRQTCPPALRPRPAVQTAFVLQGTKGEPGKGEMVDYNGNISEALQVSGSQPCGVLVRPEFWSPMSSVPLSRGGICLPEACPPFASVQSYVKVIWWPPFTTRFAHLSTIASRGGVVLQGVVGKGGLVCCRLYPLDARSTPPLVDNQNVSPNVPWGPNPRLRTSPLKETL